MRKWRYILIIFSLFGSALAGSAWLLFTRYLQPQAHEVYLLIQPGDSAYYIAQRLTTTPLERLICYGMMSMQGTASKLRAGEYLFPSGLSRAAMVEALTKGQYHVVRRFTVVEGLTVQDIVASLRQAPGFKGNVSRLPAEGYLYPDTYHYTYGEDRQKFVDQLERRMVNALEEIWRTRVSCPQLQSLQDLVTLASIVEKETGREAERPRIAAVFLNRLRTGMPLQSDPTVIYGLVGGKGKFERALTRADLKTPHVYNTYMHRGLPPGPIAIPSLASLYAVSHPETGDDFYFVSDGSGGHVFSKNLAQHQIYHQKLRRLRHLKQTSSSVKTP